MWPPDAKRSRAKSKGFENVGATPNTAVHDDRNPTGGSFKHSGQAFDCRAKCLFCAPAVIRDNQTVNTMFNRELRILTCHDSLNQQFDLTVSRSRFTKSRFMSTGCSAVTFDRSSPSNIGFRAA